MRTIVVFSSQNTTLAPVLWLYSSSPTMVGDNVAFSHVAADDSKFVGASAISMSSITAVGSKSVSFLNAGTSLLCAADSTSLYGVLVHSAAYTPASGQTFKIRALIEN